MQRFIGNLIAATILITWLVVGSSVFAKMNKIVPIGRTNIWVAVNCQVELKAYTSTGTPLEVIPFGLPSNKAVRTRIVLNAPYGDTELRFKGVVDEPYTFSVKINSDIPKIPYFEVRDPIPIEAGEFQKFIVHSDGTLENGDLQPFYHGKANPAFDPTLIGFISPIADVTNVQTGYRELRIHLMYSTRITDGFSASLNGVNLTNLFHPIPGKNEVVTLYAPLGSNITSTIAFAANGVSLTGRNVKYRSSLDFVTNCTR
jgi:hypothetical protein